MGPPPGPAQARFDCNTRGSLDLISTRELWSRPLSQHVRVIPAGNHREDGCMAGSLQVGESLVGDGAEVAHIDLLIGSKNGPVGQAFANALVNQKEGHTNL